jgi:YD repeat-containing protein
VNAVALWRKGDAIAIGTGYALSSDLLWREHSWAWDSEGRLIETTETRTRYFGVRMDGPQADWFANWIAPSSVDGSA